MEFYNYEYYLYVDQLNGSARDARHLGTSKLNKFTFAQYYMNLSGSVSSGAGIGTGKPKLVSPSDFSFELNDKDILIPRLMKLYFEGRHISEFIATEEKLFASGELAGFVSYSFKDCVLTSMKKSQSGKNQIFVVDFKSFEKKDNHVETWSN